MLWLLRSLTDVSSMIFFTIPPQLHTHTVTSLESTELNALVKSLSILPSDHYLFPFNSLTQVRPLPYFFSLFKIFNPVAHPSTA